MMEKRLKYADWSDEAVVEEMRKRLIEMRDLLLEIRDLLGRVG